MIVIRSKQPRGCAVIGLYLFLLLVLTFSSHKAHGALLGSSSLNLLRGGGGSDSGDKNGATVEGIPVHNEKVADDTNKNHQQHQRRDLQVTAKIVGNNGVPSSAFPLGECEGDCDDDGDCESGLVCVQRDSGSALPSGCTGLSTSYSTDFCAKPPSTGGGGGGSSGGSSTIARVGNDGSPSSAFPLGKCQGDCDDDGDCAGDLVCFQRRAYQSVPGCSGGTSDSTPTDYCVDSSSSGGSGGGGSGSSTSDIVLKKWWQQGYTWQDDPTEKRWCPRCSGSDCDVGDYMIHVDCDTDSPTRLRFVTQGSSGEFMIKIGGSQSGDNLCLELNTGTKNYELRSCDSNDPLQRFRSGNGSYLGSGKFEIYPKSKSGFCVTNRHHPRYGEPMRAETCESARRATTSYWIKR